MKRIDTARVLITGGDSHEEKVAKLVGTIAASRTGQAVITVIRAHGWVMIAPYEGGDFNAVAYPDPLFGQIGRIEFSPSTFESVVVIGPVKMPNYRAILFPGMQGDEVLLHEMVHAARGLGGDFRATKLTGAMAAWNTEEEFMSILVQNIYASEKGKRHFSLRRTHGLVQASLTEVEADSDVFLYLDDNYRLVDKFCRQHPKMSRLLSEVPSSFNPVRAYYEAQTVPVKTTERIPVEHKVVKHGTRPPLTDDYLISILKPRYRETDVAGYGARARQLEQVFGTLNAMEAVPLIARLELRPPGDKVAMYFHGHLATATRAKLLGIVRSRMTKL